MSKDSPNLGWVWRNLGMVLVILGLIASLTIQWAQFQTTSRLAEMTAKELDNHERDTMRHVDPVRDVRQMQDMLDHLERIDEKIDAIRENQRGH